MEEIKTITIKDRLYPQLLRKIKDPPKILYFKGNLKPEEKALALVGTRRCSPYGKRLALEIAGDLAQAGTTIVSGLAPGIDSLCHQAALEKKKRTIAVLGTGLDQKSIYPRQNLKLAKEIVKSGGLLISEYPPGTHGSSFTFPKRNRIIAGLSLGVVVIEAREKSGALITANFAKIQGKKIFAIPGPIHAQTSKGCHLLIKKGAKLAENANDILRELGLPEIKVNEIMGKTKEEKLILEILKKGVLHLDQIVEKTGLPAAKVASILTILEIEGKIKNLGEKIYTT